MLGNLIGVLFDGIAYGSLLFVISIGLSVTMGLMNFVNLAHGAFAMLGGLRLRGADDPRRRAVPRSRCRWRSWWPRSWASCWSARSTSACTRRTHLDQVMFSIGLVFMAVAAADLLLRALAAAGAAARLRCAARCRLAGWGSAPTGCS